MLLKHKITTPDTGILRLSKKGNRHQKMDMAQRSDNSFFVPLNDCRVRWWIDISCMSSRLFACNHYILDYIYSIIYVKYTFMFLRFFLYIKIIDYLSCILSCIDIYILYIYIHIIRIRFVEEGKNCICHPGKAAFRLFWKPWLTCSFGGGCICKIHLPTYGALSTGWRSLGSYESCRSRESGYGTIKYPGATQKIDAETHLIRKGHNGTQTDSQSIVALLGNP